jgi:predicted transcriptional regulator
VVQLSWSSLHELLDELLAQREIERRAVWGRGRPLTLGISIKTT